MYVIDRYVEEHFLVNRRVRPRVVTDQVWEKDVPPNAIWWTTKDMTPPTSLFESTLTDKVENDGTDHQTDQNLGNLYLRKIRVLIILN